MNNMKIQGVITTNAFLRLPQYYSHSKKIILGLLRHVLPDTLINTYTSYSHASKNNYHIKKLAEDRLQRPLMTLATAWEVLKLSEYCIKNANAFKLPILLIHGKMDRVSSQMNSVEFYGKCGSTNRTLKIFEYGLHELHCDTESDHLQQIIHSWCKKQNDLGSPIGRVF